MPESREELGLEMAREARDFQMATEGRLRDRAISVLQAASVVIPVAGITLTNSPKGVAWAFEGAGIAYIVCAAFCLAATRPYNPWFGGERLNPLTDPDESVADMQARVARHLWDMHSKNYGPLLRAAIWLTIAMIALMVEIVFLAVALIEIIG